MLGDDRYIPGYDDYSEDVLASGIPIHQSSVRQPDLYDFDDFAKWKSISTLPASNPFASAALAPPMLDVHTNNKPSYGFPSCAASCDETDISLDILSTLSNHTRSEWTPVAVTNVPFSTLDAAKEAVAKFLPSLEVCPQFTQQSKCCHYLLHTSNLKMEISIIYFKDVVVEFNLLSGCRTKFNSLFRSFRSKCSSSQPVMSSPTNLVSDDSLPVPTLDCSEFGADIIRG